MGLFRCSTSGGGSGGATKYQKVTQTVPTSTNTTVTFNSLSKIWGVRVLSGGSHCCDAFYDSENDTYSIFNTNGSSDSGYFMIKSVTDNSIVYWQKWGSSIGITAVAVGD